MLPWREAEVGGEVAARAEAVDVADEGQESRRGQDADAGHTHEERGLRQLPGQAVELVLQRRGLGLEGGDLLEHLGERVAQVARKVLLGERGACAGPRGIVTPNSRRCPRSALMRAVRVWR